MVICSATHMRVKLCRLDTSGQSLSAEQQTVAKRTHTGKTMNSLTAVLVTMSLGLVHYSGCDTANKPPPDAPPVATSDPMPPPPSTPTAVPGPPPPAPPVPQAKQLALNVTHDDSCVGTCSCNNEPPSSSTEAQCYGTCSKRHGSTVFTPGSDCPACDSFTQTWSRDQFGMSCGKKNDDGSYEIPKGAKGCSNAIIGPYWAAGNVCKVNVGFIVHSKGASILASVTADSATTPALASVRSKPDAQCCIRLSDVEVFGRKDIEFKLSKYEDSGNPVQFFRTHVSTTTDVCEDLSDCKF